jgi:TRAP-type C4-dicarboxylate transport system permease large subunit
LAQTNIVAAMLFAGLSGSVVADTSAIRSILNPSMARGVNSRQSTAAIVGASSVIGPIIHQTVIVLVSVFPPAGGPRHPQLTGETVSGMLAGTRCNARGRS